MLNIVFTDILDEEESGADDAEPMDVDEEINDEWDEWETEDEDELMEIDGE